MKTAGPIPLRAAQRERRVDYRLKYPPALSPVLKLGPHEHQVLDISEFGIRFATGPDHPTPGQRFRATVKFRHAPARSVTGCIVRISGQDIAAQLDRGIDFQVIAREHDWVMMQRP